MARELIDEARMLAEEYHRACIGCLLCTPGCVSYRALGAARYSPPRRLRAAYHVLVKGSPTSEDIETIYTCTMCGACTILCPYGIEVWRVVLAARIKLSIEGKQPQSLQEIARNIVRGHSFTPNPEAPKKLLLSIAEKVGVPVDEPADYLYIPSPFETTIYPDILEDALTVLKKAGYSIAVSTKALDLGGNAAFDAARPDVALNALANVINTAEELGVRGIVLSGCGADHKLLLLAKHYSWLTSNMEAVNIYELIHQHIRMSGGGRGENNKDRLLFPSCGFARFERESYPSVKALTHAKPPRDKPPYTLCCGGGGGLNYLREQPLATLRNRIYEWRIRNLCKGCKAREIVTPCIKCYTVLRHGVLLAKLYGKVKVTHLVQAVRRQHSKEPSRANTPQASNSPG
ncbi:(Fe-S)-binding protein [Hyperthermus butylicus]|uniref:(Fe-S)-binding protein n=1 Tax=Hyperthermus butylicus TaxID=54248 RepID=UPI0018915409|nr:(Fe-S)-binding protein [Hyperthermus butylicus]